MGIGVGFGEIVSTMVWPRLLAAAGLALRPARLGLALVMLVLLGLIAQLPRLWLAKGDAGPASLGREGLEESLAVIAAGVVHLDHVELGAGLARLFVATPVQVGQAYPWSTLAIAAPMLVVWAVLGGAISRMTATEFSLQNKMGWTQGLAFAISKAGSLAAAKIGVLVVVAFIGLVLAAGGWLLLNFAFLQLVGGALFVVALLASGAAVLMVVSYLLAMPMLVPAVACEGTDAIDAVQRAHAYVFARPLRVGLYVLVLVVELVVVTLLLAAIAHATVAFATWCTTAWLSPEMQSLLREQAATGTAAVGETVSWSARSTGSMVGFWAQIPGLLVAAFVTSFWFSGGTVLYLLVRQVCDGQDVGELWMPGMVGGTHAGAGAATPLHVDTGEGPVDEDD